MPVEDAALPSRFIQQLALPRFAQKAVGNFQALKTPGFIETGEFQTAFLGKAGQRVDPATEPACGAPLVTTPVVLIRGDGIGPEVTQAAQAIVQAAGAHVDWVEADAGLAAADRHGDPL